LKTGSGRDENEDEDEAIAAEQTRNLAHRSIGENQSKEYSRFSHQAIAT
jgi:hypothetical protein